MTPLYDSAAVREVERAAFARRPSFALMRDAGGAVAVEAAKMIARKRAKALAIAGPGNNGGDALVAAAVLKKRGWGIDVVLCAGKNKLPPDAAQALQQWRGSVVTLGDFLRAPGDGYDIAIDGLLGIGVNRPLGGEYSKLAKLINAAPFPVLSIDAPSGVNTDTGGGESIFAARTVTFFADKIGLRTGKGKAAAGEVVVCDLNEKMTLPPRGMMHNSLDDFNFACLRRRADGHKGDYGTVFVIGGNEGMLGALALASRACARLGAGKVFAMPLAKNAPACDFIAPEVMWRKFGNVKAAADVIAIGVGLGVNAEAKKTMKKAMSPPLPLVIDADALNLLAADEALKRQVKKRKAPTIITPHPAEAARLLKCQTSKVQNDRIAAATTLAKQTNAIAVLKGAGTIVSSPSGEWTICAAGNPGLAQAGSGDVLTGMIAALLAQTKDATFSARAGVYLHAAAADELSRTNGEIGLNINNIAPTAAKLLNQIKPPPFGRGQGAGTQL